MEVRRKNFTAKSEVVRVTHTVTPVEYQEARPKRVRNQLSPENEAEVARLHPGYCGMSFSSKLSSHPVLRIIPALKGSDDGSVAGTEILKIPLPRFPWFPKKTSKR